MKTETVIFVSPSELRPFLAAFLGRPDNDSYDWVAEMNPDDGNWRKGTIHRLSIEPADKLVTVNHEQFLRDAKEQGQIHWNWELHAVMSNAGALGQIPCGEYIIEV